MNNAILSQYEQLIKLLEVTPRHLQHQVCKEQGIYSQFNAKQAANYKPYQLNLAL